MNITAFPATHVHEHTYDVSNGNMGTHATQYFFGRLELLYNYTDIVNQLYL